MPVMKQLNVGGVTYDTVGEASVTQVVSTGTKIATVSIDGTSTDLYAPSGGSSVEPATDAPIVDGTAAVGTSAKYAREDHVHPTDTSRQATLVSGTNIKTVNGNSLLGSGDLDVGGDVSMTEEEVDAAVRAAWPVYTITNNASSYATVDMTSAGEYETVTVTVTSLNGIQKVDVSDQNGMFAYFNTVGTHTFTMPASNVTLTASNGGDN